MVLVAGDGDFRDLVGFVTQQLYKKVWIVGYKGSMNSALIEKATPGCVIYIDDIWDLISEAKSNIVPQEKDS